MTTRGGSPHFTTTRGETLGPTTTRAKKLTHHPSTAHNLKAVDANADDVDLEAPAEGSYTPDYKIITTYRRESIKLYCLEDWDILN